MAAANFKGVAEKFRMSLLDGQNPERIQVEVGLEGVKLLSEDGGRALRIYPLNHISRWALRDTQLVLYTKTPVDVEERAVTLQAPKNVTQSVLDTLTCSCMQMCELLQNEEEGNTSSGRSRKESEDNAQWAASILNGGSSRGRQNPEDVEFWHHADKEGWLQSQGDKLKTWRRRWHVLKDGYIFRFMEADVNSNSKPRGITNCSEVTEVSDGKDSTGRNNALKLVTSKGNVNYIADSETEQVEWISAIEAAICKIHDDKDPNPPPQSKPKPKEAKPSASGSADWMRQLEKSYSSASAPGGRSGGGSGQVKVVGYDAPAGGYAGGAPGSRSSSGNNLYNQHYPTLSAPPSTYGASAPPPTEDFSALSLGYSIAGAHTSDHGGTAYSEQQSFNSAGSGGYGAGLARHGSASGDYGNSYSAPPPQPGYTAADPNYGAYGQPPNQTVSVSGYDVFSGGPDYPSSNYPSMQPTVADYTNQEYAPQPHQPGGSSHGNDYWSQGQQQEAMQGGWDNGQGGAPPHSSAEYGYQQQYSQQPPVNHPPPDYGQQQPQQPQHEQHYSQMVTGQPDYGRSYQQPPAYEQPPPVPQQQQLAWQPLYTPEGQQYWHNPSTGITQWETPSGMA